MNVRPRPLDHGLQFNLLRYFSLACFAVFVAVTAIMCTGFYHISKYYIRMDAEQRAVPIAERLGSLAFIDGTQPSSPGTSAYARLDSLMRSALEPLRIFKISIYDAEGRIVYSTNPRLQVGTTDPGNRKLARALAGEVISGLQTRVNGGDLHEDDDRHVVVETYVPVPRNAPDTPMRGVVEIYSDVTATYARLPGLIALIVIASVMAMSILYGILYLIVQRASDIIHEQTQTISQSKQDVEKYAAELEERVEQRTRELRETLAQQRHDEKMVAIGTLAAGIAHELNTPLGTILGSTQLVLEHCLSRLEGVAEGCEGQDRQGRCRQCAEDLSRVESQARRCREIIRNLVDFSRKSDGDRSWTHLGELVQQSVALLEPAASTQDVRFDVRVEEDLPLVRVSANEIQQVLVNIVNNGIAAMPEGGVLSVRVTHEGEVVRIEIEDTGTGIEEADLPRVFDPFFTTKEVGKGTGLGLAISYRIVKDHGGNVFISSQLGKGSTFVIELDAQNGEPERQTQLPHPSDVSIMESGHGSS